MQFATIIDTHYTALRSLAELCNIIPKVAEQKLTNKYNGCWRDLAIEPDPLYAPITHQYPTRQQKWLNIGGKPIEYPGK